MGSATAQQQYPKQKDAAIIQLKQDSIQITVTDNRISVVNAPVGSKLEIFSVVGLKVREIEMKQPTGEYIVNIAKGYYIIRIEETVRKVAIR
ncbi:hypothetical protein A9168_14310 [Macellibacteroides sp. HH-ZS]|nr:hypothetical protein A9168_14310 [Macellibacteroides sp. HH-ZS]